MNSQGQIELYEDMKNGMQTQDSFLPDKIKGGTSTQVNDTRNFIGHSGSKYNKQNSPSVGGGRMSGFDPSEAQQISRNMSQTLPPGSMSATMNKKAPIKKNSRAVAGGSYHQMPQIPGVKNPDTVNEASEYLEGPEAFSQH